MRISDWTSAVCSSDRKASTTLISESSGLAERAFSQTAMVSDVALSSPASLACVRHLSRQACASSAQAGVTVADLERKSGVQGRSVSVLVVLGGRRISTKQIDIILIIVDVMTIQ